MPHFCLFSVLCVTIIPIIRLSHSLMASWILPDFCGTFCTFYCVFFGSVPIVTFILPQNFICFLSFLPLLTHVNFIRPVTFGISPFCASCMYERYSCTVYFCSKIATLCLSPFFIDHVIRFVQISNMLSGFHTQTHILAITWEGKHFYLRFVSRSLLCVGIERTSLSQSLETDICVGLKCVYFFISKESRGSSWRRSHLPASASFSCMRMDHLFQYSMGIWVELE